MILTPLSSVTSRGSVSLPCLVVDRDDPAALAAALRQVLTQPRLAGSMAAEARQLAAQVAWPVVAEAYLGLARRSLAERQRRS